MVEIAGYTPSIKYYKKRRQNRRNDQKDCDREGGNQKSCPPGIFEMLLKGPYDCFFVVATSFSQ